MTPTIITFPSIANPARVDWILERFDGTFTSPLSGAVQQIVRPGARWGVTLSWSTLSEADWHALAAWLAQMATGGYRCPLPNYAYRQLGGAPTTAAVYGNTQTGGNIKLCGLTAGASKQFKAGDMIALASPTQHQLVMATADTDASTMTTTWAALTTYAAGTLIKDSNGNAQYCTVGGTSGSTAPAWSLSGSTTDGSVTWYFIGPLGYATVPITPSLRFSPTFGASTPVTASPSAYFMKPKPTSQFSHMPPRLAATTINLIEDILI